MYLVVGELRLPWAFRPWRGKDTTTPAQLGLKLLRTLPQELRVRFRVQVLADTGFSSVEFLAGVRKQGYHAIVGMPKNRLLTNGKALKTITRKGQLVKLQDLTFEVSAAWFYPASGWQIGKKICDFHSPTKGKYHYVVGVVAVGRLKVFLRLPNTNFGWLSLDSRLC